MVSSFENFHSEVNDASSRKDVMLGFDPDKLIEPSELKIRNPESQLSSQETLAAPVRKLDHTNQPIIKLDNGNTLFDSPHETGKALNCNQGCAIEGVEGDCGLVSVENISRLAGKHITEADVFKIASENKLCETGNADPGLNGGTNFIGLCMVLEKIGINTRPSFATDATYLAEVVESGRGVIAVIDTALFWNQFPYEICHAVTITSVERAVDGRPIAFYVCDSGTGGVDASRRVPASLMMRCLSEYNPLIVTDKPIR